MDILPTVSRRTNLAQSTTSLLRHLGGVSRVPLEVPMRGGQVKARVGKFQLLPRAVSKAILFRGPECYGRYYLASTSFIPGLKVEP